MSITKQYKILNQTFIFEIMIRINEREKRCKKKREKKEKKKKYQMPFALHDVHLFSTSVIEGLHASFFFFLGRELLALIYGREGE